MNSKIDAYRKTIQVDSDKSLSIRSFLIGSISQDISKANNILESEDVFSTINCLKKLGVKIKKNKPRSYSIYGKGLGSLFARKNLKLIDVASGTGDLAKSYSERTKNTADITCVEPNISMLDAGKKKTK